MIGCPAMRALDTTPEAFERQIGIYANMSAQQRLGIGLDLTLLSRSMLRDGIRSRHPEYSEAQVRLAFLRVWLGRELFLRAYPGAPEIEP
jgi:hypothetical protein